MRTDHGPESCNPQAAPCLTSLNSSFWPLFTSAESEIVQGTLASNLDFSPADAVSLIQAWVDTLPSAQSDGNEIARDMLPAMNVRLAFRYSRYAVRSLS